MVWRLLVLPLAAALLVACGGDDVAPDAALPADGLAIEICGDDAA